MALEYLKQGEFVLKSDVWSFGVVLWEIYSLGGKPYGLEKCADVKKKLMSGWRMPEPEYIEQLGPGDDFYNQAILPCWEAVIDKRPTFTTLVDQLGRYSRDPTVHHPQAVYKITVPHDEDWDNDYTLISQI